ncbi:ribosomal RNA small subunit methyltransferase B [Companilactobacillus sp. RD055328]|uniref:16S rRNA (cytosine(967)-C(5))-methyltransferase RsmB n=1 Tax=Companilactobacillus sp. RD055328 TaxID=2916634 RepID=UPI001FC8A374|nr:16S rRNA (cytosine(967)-C(5))-methyltransferase RsmB [Companilactobacillus sp. RD055328]GKQ42564.1 ribosomal RNA small subunit methyltransferase B [Companilactobacillus sp. RD055328]
MNNNARYIALNILNSVLINDAYSNVEINRAINKEELNSKDIGLMTNIVYGVLQNKLTLDFYLQDYLKGKKVDPWVNTLLLISIYQMEFLDKVPDRAVIYESVEIAKRKGNRGISGFVNGVLRSYQRQGHKDVSIIQDIDNQLSVKHSVPVWIVRLLKEQLGLEKTKSILESLNYPSSLSIRVNTKKISRNDLKSKLLDKGIETIESEISPFGLVTDDHRVINSSEFKEGLYTIQDESSMLVAPALQVKADSIVLDACAAPGGKTTHIASFLDENQGGSVLALDIYDHKLDLINQNSERLGMSKIIKTQNFDATHIEALDQKFDRILIDAPCSGLGLLRRKPEMRYNKTSSDISELIDIQRNILNSAADSLNIGGILVYSTCTIVDEENSQQVQNFLDTHDNFEQVDVLTSLGNSDDKMVKLYPDDYQTDGFFISAIKRTK